MCIEIVIFIFSPAHLQGSNDFEWSHFWSSALDILNRADFQQLII